MRIAALITAFLALTACTTNPVYLKNAAGETVKCGPYVNNDLKAQAAAMQEAQCIQDYKEQGYKRAPQN